MGAWESKRWEPKRIGDGAVDNKGGAQGKPGRRGDGNPPQESGTGGAAGGGRRGGGRRRGGRGIRGKTGVKDGRRVGCEERKILASPSPYPFLVSDQS